VYVELLISIWLLFKIITGLQNFDKDNVASVVTAAEKVLYLTLSALFFLSSSFGDKYSSISTLEDKI
jgi:hypothetical protein